MIASPWAWHPHPDVWLLVAVLVAAYILGARQERARVRPEPSRIQRTAFALGLVSLVLAADWPVHDIAERYLLWVHMLQHLVITLIMPPLLLVALTPAMLRRVIGPAMPVVRRLARPLPASVLFNAFIVFSHWPAVVNTVVRHEPLHFLVHVVLVGTAVLMWLPVVSTAEDVPRLRDPARLVYLFLQSVVPTFPASFLTFAESPLYAVYDEAPRVFGTSAVADQQLAGALMKLGGGAVLWGLIIVLFFRWYSREQERERSSVGVGTLRWSDVERELASTPAPPEPPLPS